MSEEADFIDVGCQDSECAGRFGLQFKTARIMLITFEKIVALRVIYCESLLVWAGWWLRGWVNSSEFYQQVLGLECSWKVEQVELDRAAQR